MKKLYLVTGISGHLGSTVASALLESGQGAVRGFDLPAVRHNNLRGDVEMVYGDITKPEELEPAFLHAEDEELCVIHCAGIVSAAAGGHFQTERGGDRSSGMAAADHIILRGFNAGLKTGTAVRLT